MKGWEWRGWEWRRPHPRVMVHHGGLCKLQVRLWLRAVLAMGGGGGQAEVHPRCNPRLCPRLVPPSPSKSKAFSRLLVQPQVHHIYCPPNNNNNQWTKAAPEPAPLSPSASAC
jgi:hypothetical protein